MKFFDIKIVWGFIFIFFVNDFVKGMDLVFKFDDRVETMNRCDLFLYDYLSKYGNLEDQIRLQDFAGVVTKIYSFISGSFSINDEEMARSINGGFLPLNKKQKNRIIKIIIKSVLNRKITDYLGVYGLYCFFTDYKISPKSIISIFGVLKEISENCDDAERFVRFLAPEGRVALRSSLVKLITNLNQTVVRA